MATGGKERDARGAREARERAKVYRARQEFHASLRRRSRRDNIIGGVVGAVIVLGAIGLQTAYFTAGPGAPAPAPTSTEAPTPAPSASESAPVPADPAVSPSPGVTP